MSVTFSRAQKSAEATIRYNAYCIACGRSASLDVTPDEETAPRGTLLVMRQLRTMLMRAGCEESGVTAAIKIRPPRSVPAR